MARPTKAQARRKALGKDSQTSDPFKNLTDGQVLSEVQDRFTVGDRMIEGAVHADIRGFILSGAPGVGKTYNVEQAIKRRQAETDNDPNKFRCKIIKGAVSPIHLYKTLWDYQRPQDMILLDDSDSIFFDDNGVALLKAALDSSPQRFITWASEAAMLKQEDIPDTFEYRGSMIFITNTDFQGIVDEGKSKLVPHLEALLSRSMYLDLKIHNRRGIGIWVTHLIRTKKILQQHLGLTETQERQAVEWLNDNREDLRTLSIRDALKIGQLMKSDYDSWEKSAEILLLRN